MDLTNIVQNYKENIIEIAKQIGNAKGNLKRKEYSTLIDVSGLSKDQVSLSLKRFSLLQDQFDTDLLTDYSDRMIKKITAKIVTVNVELMKARRKLGKGEISYEEFCMLADTFKVIKTDDEKGISKAEALVKFVDKSNIGAEAMIKISEIVKPLADYTDEEENDA